MSFATGGLGLAQEKPFLYLSPYKLKKEPMTPSEFQLSIFNQRLVFLGFDFCFCCFLLFFG